ncbi:hypothetical protein X777_04504 [Ooceraea biroi]|uniref:Uncharacterized protein n=1 Tax=Ooceraea biroi TaxID=2015173 RepID=A0A026WIW3_OOCBI|nr:hypothetical protein X777_04504 [Ooceraea biroi]
MRKTRLDIFTKREECTKQCSQNHEQREMPGDFYYMIWTADTIHLGRTSSMQH